MGWMDGMDGSPGGPRYRAPTVLIKVFSVYFDVKLAETIQCNQKSLFTQMNFHNFCPVRNVKKVVTTLK